MNNALYVGLSRQETLQRALDIVANNIANAVTAGFKLEQLLVQTEPGSPPSTPDARPVNYVLDHGVTRDFTQGSMDQTGNPYDVAVEGLGFFQIQTAGGMRYTRDGRFTVDNKNQLVTKAGDPVMDAGGRHHRPHRGADRLRGQGRLGLPHHPAGRPDPDRQQAGRGHRRRRRGAAPSVA